MARLRLGLGSPSPLGFASESTVLGSPSTGGLEEAAPAQGEKSGRHGPPRAASGKVDAEDAGRCAATWLP